MNFSLIVLFTILLNSVQCMEIGSQHSNGVPQAILRRSGPGGILKVEGSLYIVSDDCTDFRPATRAEKEAYSELKRRYPDLVIRRLPLIKLESGDILVRGDEEIGVVQEGDDWFTEIKALKIGHEERIGPDGLDKLKRNNAPFAIFENNTWIPLFPRK